MANERMYLVHEPSGLYGYVGKRMGWGWYDVGNNTLQALFDKVAYEPYDGDQDAYAVALEGDERLKEFVK